MQFNKLMLSGEVTKCETVTLPRGGTMVKVSMLCQEEVKGQDWKKQMYISVPCFGEVAKAASGVKQGDYILVDGKLNVRSYDKKDGSKGLDVQLVPSNIIRLGFPEQTINNLPSNAPNHSITQYTETELDTIPF